MTQNEKKRSIAERLFVEQNYTAKAIAETIGMTEKTIGNWKEKFGWEEKKLNNDSAPHEIKRLLLEEAQRIIKGEDPRFNADFLSKIMRALERVDKSVNTQMVISVFKEFDNWLLGEDVDNFFRELTMDKHKHFIQYKVENE